MTNTTDEKAAKPNPPPNVGADLVGGLTGFAKGLFKILRKSGLGEGPARRLVGGTLASLGLGKAVSPGATPTDTGTTLAYERTDMAMERTFWAAERTLMAWIRTALSMISFGFTIGKLGDAIGDIHVQGFRGMKIVGTGTIAYLLVCVGTGALLAAAVQYALRVNDLCEKGLKREPSIAFVVALLLAILGLGAFSSLVLKF